MARNEQNNRDLVARLRAELEGRAKARRETKPFVAHGGKPPSPPPSPPST